jgi:hypothetical protein
MKTCTKCTKQKEFACLQTRVIPHPAFRFHTILLLRNGLKASRGEQEQEVEDNFQFHTI